MPLVGEPFAREGWNRGCEPELGGAVRIQHISWQGWIGIQLVRTK
jgi:hypothetical protein